MVLTSEVDFNNFDTVNPFSLLCVSDLGDTLLLVSRYICRFDFSTCTVLYYKYLG